MRNTYTGGLPIELCNLERICNIIDGIDDIDVKNELGDAFLEFVKDIGKERLMEIYPELKNYHFQDSSIDEECTPIVLD